MFDAVGGRQSKGVQFSFETLILMRLSCERKAVGGRANNEDELMASQTWELRS
jgi:hypothetical protein